MKYVLFASAVFLNAIPPRAALCELLVSECRAGWTVGSQAWGQTLYNVLLLFRSSPVPQNCFVAAISGWHHTEERSTRKVPTKDISVPGCVLLILSWIFRSYQPWFYFLEMSFMKSTQEGTVTNCLAAHFGPRLFRRINLMTKFKTLFNLNHGCAFWNFLIL